MGLPQGFRGANAPKVEVLADVFHLVIAPRPRNTTPFQWSKILKAGMKKVCYPLALFSFTNYITICSKRPPGPAFTRSNPSILLGAQFSGWL